MKQNLYSLCSQPGGNSWRLGFTYRYIDDVLSINNPEFENYLGQMYPVELEIKDTTESNTSASYLDLLLSIGGTVNFTLPFMTNVTISISTSQMFRSWVAIFQPRPPMVSLFRYIAYNGISIAFKQLFLKTKNVDTRRQNTNFSIVHLSS